MRWLMAERDHWLERLVDAVTEIQRLNREAVGSPTAIRITVPGAFHTWLFDQLVRAGMIVGAYIDPYFSVITIQTEFGPVEIKRG